MLDMLRRYASGWVAQLLMGILVLSFAVWGIADVFTGFQSDSIAKVGNADVTVVDYQRTYDTTVRALSQQYGQALTPDQARAIGVPQRVLAQLVGAATLSDAADKMGLGISDAALGQRIVSDPQFAGTAGAFDRSLMNQVVQSQGYTEDDFVVKRRADFVRSQLVDAFAGGATAPEAYLRAVHEYQTEERKISYVTLTAPPASAIADPSETDLATYFDANKSKWASPETRKITYFLASPDEIAKPDQVSDDDAKKRYDSQPERWTTIEKRDVQQIVFKDQAEAAAAAAALSAGKTFDDLVAERKLLSTDIDLGTVAKTAIAAPAVADAAFALPEGGVSGVVDGEFGPTIVSVTKIEPAVTTPFEDVKADLKKEIATEQALAQLQTMHDAIEDARAGGATLAEVAAKYGFKIVNLPALDSGGKDIDGKDVPNVPAALVAAAFASDVGIENDPIKPDDNSWVWYDVTDKADPHDRPLAEVHDQVVAAWKDEQRQKLLDTQADTVKSKIEGGADIAAVAPDFALTVNTVDKLTRVATPRPDLSPVAITEAFAGPKGSVAVADGPAPMTKIVMQVEDVSMPPFDPKAPELTQVKDTLDGQFVNDVLALYLSDLATKTAVRYNDATLQQVLGGTTTN